MLVMLQTYIKILTPTSLCSFKTSTHMKRLNPTEPLQNSNAQLSAADWKMFRDLPSCYIPTLWNESRIEVQDPFEFLLIEHLNFNQEDGAHRPMIWEAQTRAPIWELLGTLPQPQYAITPCWRSFFFCFIMNLANISAWISFILVSWWKVNQAFLPTNKSTPTY